MEYVVCYDIADDGRRSRVAETLLNYGPRAQESVFVLHLESSLYERMMKELHRIMDPATDKIHVFGICGACEAKAIALGLGVLPKDQEFYIL